MNREHKEFKNSGNISWKDAMHRFGGRVPLGIGGAGPAGVSASTIRIADKLLEVTTDYVWAGSDDRMPVPPEPRVLRKQWDADRCEGGSVAQDMDQWFGYVENGNVTFGPFDTKLDAQLAVEKGLGEIGGWGSEVSHQPDKAMGGGSAGLMSIGPSQTV